MSDDAIEGFIELISKGLSILIIMLVITCICICSCCYCCCRTTDCCFNQLDRQYNKPKKTTKVVVI